MMLDVIDDSHNSLSFIAYCPGCKMLHVITANPEAMIKWDWNGDRLKPTFSPSLLVRYTVPAGDVVCHSFIRNGQWQFLSDCTHSLAGQTVNMLPDPWAIEDEDYASEIAQN